MGRCRVCRKDVLISASHEVGKPVRIWPSYKSLVELATNGCDLCALFRQYLSTYVSEKVLRETAGDVRLYGGGERLTIECAPFDGAIAIPFTAATDGSQSLSISKDCDVTSQAKKWLSRCLAGHSSCREQSFGHIHSASHLPKRLLDLAHGTSILIVNVADWISSGLATVSDFSEYCTLSYRWGTASHDCVLSANFQMLLEMPLGSMPDTFKDAITTTRNLGIRYLWIDALCIVQPAASGDHSDWQAEGARMGVVYQNALLNISATCADKADDGFLTKLGISENDAVPCKVVRHEQSKPADDTSDRPAPAITTTAEREVILPVCEPSFFMSVSSSELNSRGWVVQERALSKRLLHFTEHGLFWECCEMKAHHGFGDFDPGRDNGPCRTKETLLSIARARRTRHLCPVEWFHFVRKYSFAGFTDAKDRLIALSSVAEAAQPILGNQQYYAGLWRGDLVRGLMWSAHTPSTERFTAEGVAPSWSWASVEGAISFAALGLDTYQCELVDVRDVEVVPTLAANPFGNLRRGVLTLFGRLDRMLLPTCNVHVYSPRQVVTWDTVQDATEKHRTFTILPMGACSGLVMRPTLFGALILETQEGSIADSGKVIPGHVYRRIGWVEYSPLQHFESGRYHHLKQDWIQDRGQEISIL